jgi:hypothetical protein
VARISGLEDHFEAARTFYGPAVDLRKVRVRAAGSCSEAAPPGPATASSGLRTPDEARTSICPHSSTSLGMCGSTRPDRLRFSGAWWSNSGGSAAVIHTTTVALSGAQHVTRLQDLTMESQAMILEEYWRSRQKGGRCPGESVHTGPRGRPSATGRGSRDRHHSSSQERSGRRLRYRRRLGGEPVPRALRLVVLPGGAKPCCRSSLRWPSATGQLFRPSRRRLPARW